MVDVASYLLYCAYMSTDKNEWSISASLALSITSMALDTLQRVYYKVNLSAQVFLHSYQEAPSSWNFGWLVDPNDVHHLVTVETI
jgi:hypothetical protein